MASKNIFLIDDNLYFLNAAMEFIRTDDEINIIGYSQKSIESIEIIKNKKPDLVIVDYVMAGMNGIEIAKILKTLESPPKVIIVTQFDSSDYRDQALKNGADGFVPKAKFGDEIIPLIRDLLEN